MRFLVDANLSPRISDRLSDSGFPARHVRGIGMVDASNDAIFDRAAADADVVVTADTDFGMLLANRRSDTPSVVQLRHVNELRPGVSPSGASRSSRCDDVDAIGLRPVRQDGAECAS